MLKLLKEHRKTFKKPKKTLDTLSFKAIDKNNPFEFAIGKMYKRIKGTIPNYIQKCPTKKQVKKFRIEVFNLPELYSKRTKSVITHTYKKDPELHLENYGNFYLKQLTLEPYLKRNFFWHISNPYYRGLKELVAKILVGKKKKQLVSVSEGDCRPVIGSICTVQLLNNYRESYWLLFKKTEIPKVILKTFSVVRQKISDFIDLIILADIERRLLVKNSFEWSVLFELRLKNCTPFLRSPQWLRIAKWLTPFKIYDTWTFCVYWFLKKKNIDLTMQDNWYLVNSQWPIFYKDDVFLYYQNSFMTKGLRNTITYFYKLIKVLKVLGLAVSRLILLVLEQSKPYVFFIGCKRNKDEFKVLRALHYDRQYWRSILWNKQSLPNQENDYFINRLVFSFFSKLTSHTKTYYNMLSLYARLLYDRGLININKWPKRVHAYKKRWRKFQRWHLKKYWKIARKVMKVKQRFMYYLKGYNEYIS